MVSLAGNLIKNWQFVVSLFWKCWCMATTVPTHWLTLDLSLYSSLYVPMGGFMVLLNIGLSMRQLHHILADPIDQSILLWIVQCDPEGKSWVIRGQITFGSISAVANPIEWDMDSTVIKMDMDGHGIFNLKANRRNWWASHPTPTIWPGVYKYLIILVKIVHGVMSWIDQIGSRFNIIVYGQFESLLLKMDFICFSLQTGNWTHAKGALSGTHKVMDAVQLVEVGVRNCLRHYYSSIVELGVNQCMVKWQQCILVPSLTCTSYHSHEVQSLFA